MKNILITTMLASALLFAGCKKTTSPPYIGVWVMSGNSLQLNANNTYTIVSSNATSTVREGGTYTATNTNGEGAGIATLNFMADSGACRSDQTGSYSYSIVARNAGGFNPTSNSVLTLSLVNDGCSWRSANLPGTYNQQYVP